MKFRAMSTAFGIGAISVVIISFVVSQIIRDGLFEDRLNQILSEVSRSNEQAQSTLNAATVTGSSQVQQLLNDLLSVLQTGGSTDREVFIIRALDASDEVSVLGVATAPGLTSIISPQLRQAVNDSGGDQRWQSINFPLADATQPGILVGSLIDVPLAGEFELYYLYSLQKEQDTLGFIQGIVAGAGAVLVLVLVLVTYVIAKQTIYPVKKAVQVAERLTDGHLDARIAVKGHDEMATLGRSFNEMAQSLEDQIGRLESLSSLQRRFVSDVSHELRTPLTTIRMAADLIYQQRPDFPPELQRPTEILVAQLDRFESLLVDLLEISRFDAGAAVLEVERHDLQQLVKRVLHDTESLLKEKKVELSVSYHVAGVWADFDMRRVERIVRNLVINAIEYGAGTEIEITMGENSECVALRVRDYGIGMTSKEQNLVFDRFWRADPARTRTLGGSGLGLSIALEDAILHGGNIEVWSKPGKGTAFILLLPKNAQGGIENWPLEVQVEAKS